MYLIGTGAVAPPLKFKLLSETVAFVVPMVSAQIIQDELGGAAGNVRAQAAVQFMTMSLLRSAAVAV